MDKKCCIILHVCSIYVIFWFDWSTYAQFMCYSGSLSRPCIGVYFYVLLQSAQEYIPVWCTGMHACNITQCTAQNILVVVIKHKCKHKCYTFHSRRMSIHLGENAQEISIVDKLCREGKSHTQYSGNSCTDHCTRFYKNNCDRE